MPKIQSQAEHTKVVKTAVGDTGSDGSKGASSARMCTPPTVLQFGQIGAIWELSFSFTEQSPIWELAGRNYTDSPKREVPQSSRRDP
jgi:hypothetical protein